MRISQQVPVLACVAAMEIAWLAVVTIGDLRTAIPTLWVLFAVAFVGYLVASLYISRGRGSLGSILIAGVIFRGTLLPTTPSLSDDIYRYLWDGRMQIEKINPYLYAPKNAPVSLLQNTEFAAINHKHVPTIYPPLAQLLFYGVTAICRSITAMKVALLSCEAILVLALIRLLRHTNRDVRRVVWYVWNPLAVLEIAGSGHIDILGVALCMTAVAALLEGRRSIAALCLAAATLSKLIPLIAAPLLWRELGGGSWRNLRNWVELRGRLPWLLLPAGIAAGYSFYFDAGIALFTGLSIYLAEWQFNSAIFTLLYESVLLVYSEPKFADGVARILVAVFMAVIAFTVLLTIDDPLRALFVLLSAVTLLSPTLHPWYLLWILPFLPFFPKPAWIAFSGLVILAYEVLGRYSLVGVWEEQGWVTWVQYTPFVLLLLAEPLVLRHRRHGPPRRKRNIVSAFSFS